MAKKFVFLVFQNRSNNWATRGFFKWKYKLTIKVILAKPNEPNEIVFLNVHRAI